MHSRISSSRPSSIFLGKKGSAIDGRAAPIRSSIPLLICRTISSGEVKRPTPTTGLDVSGLTKLFRGSCAPCSLNRAEAVSTVQLADFTSHRSGSSDNVEMISWASDCSVSPGTFSRSSLLNLTVSVLGHVIIVAAVYAIVRGLDLPVGFADCLMLVPAVMLFATIPISIAGWGVREGAMVTAFALVGASENDAGHADRDDGGDAQ